MMALFTPSYTYTNGTGLFPELPGTQHGGACGLAFADGSAVIHKWRSGLANTPVTYKRVIDVNVANNPDMTWFAQSHAATKMSTLTKLACCPKNWSQATEPLLVSAPDPEPQSSRNNQNAHTYETQLSHSVVLALLFSIPLAFLRLLPLPPWSGAGRIPPTPPTGPTV